MQLGLGWWNGWTYDSLLTLPVGWNVDIIFLCCVFSASYSRFAPSEKSKITLNPSTTSLHISILQSHRGSTFVSSKTNIVLVRADTSWIFLRTIVLTFSQVEDTPLSVEAFPQSRREHWLPCFSHGFPTQWWCLAQRVTSTTEKHVLMVMHWTGKQTVRQPVSCSLFHRKKKETNAEQEQNLYFFLPVDEETIVFQFFL